MPSVIYKVSHWTLRTLVEMNVLHFFLDLYRPRYDRMLSFRGSALNWLVVYAPVALSLLLPFFAIIELWWMRHLQSERLGTIIDVVCSVAWGLVFWGWMFVAGMRFSI